MALATGLFLISAVVLALEIVLLRLLSITQWYHFAYLVVSVALLGFGSSGTVLTFLESRIKRDSRLYAWLWSVLLGVSVPICYLVSSHLPFHIQELAWDPRQFTRLFLHALLLFVPFFFGASVIGTILTAEPERAHFLYGVNLVGSGMGALVGVLTLYGSSPVGILLAASEIALVASATFIYRRSRALAAFSVLAAALSLWLFTFVWPLPLPISPYKSLSQMLQWPGSEKLARAFSPIAMVDVVKSPAVHKAPGLSLTYQGELPPQLALFFDGDSMSPIARWNGDLRELEYLDYTTSALAYHLMEKPKVLVVGAGGGADILLALRHQARDIRALEVDPSVIELLGKKFAKFSGNIFSRPEVKVFHAEGRGFLESTSDTFDLIHIGPIDSFAASSAGVYALSENYLYTVEALGACIRRLSPSGILSMTRWARNPPRDEIKLFATACVSLEREGIKEPAEHLAFIRSWSTTTLLVKRSKLSDEDAEKIRAFSETRSFDTIYFPGINPKETNRFHQLEDDTYASATVSILSANRENFLKEYPFEITPATDDRPYFFHFLKWKSVEVLRKLPGKLWVPYVEWGYVVLLTVIGTSVVAGFILILLPLRFLRAKSGRTPMHRGKLPVFLYFASLGSAFMLLEMSFFQKFTLFLSYPVFSMAAVITSFLVFSGIGSLSSVVLKWRKEIKTTAAIAGIAVVALYYLFRLDFWLGYLQSANDIPRILFAVLLVAPLGLLMGIPFPTGLSRLTLKPSGLVPWAWGINGFASVLGASLTTFLAISLGFRKVVLIAVGLYVLAACTQFFFPKEKPR